MIKIRSTVLASLTGIFLFSTALTYASNAKLVLGTKVEKHVMQNERDNFAFHDGQVWAQIELKPSTDGQITFVWTHDGKPYAEFKAVTKKSDRYRTQAFVTARPGKWHVAVKSDTNVILAEKSFTVDGIDSSMISKSNDAKKAPKTEEKVDTNKISGINDALKAMNPTDAKPKVKTDDKPTIKANPSPEKIKADIKTEEAKPVDAKPTDVQYTDTKASDINPTNKKEADIKPASPKA